MNNHVVAVRGHIPTRSLSYSLLSSSHYVNLSYSNAADLANYRRSIGHDLLRPTHGPDELGGTVRHLGKRQGLPHSIFVVLRKGYKLQQFAVASFLFARIGELARPKFL